MTIQAAVRCEPLVAKLSEVNVTTAPLPGAKLFAQAVSQTAAEKDALTLLRSALVGFPHTIIEATSEGEPKIVERSEENVTISYQVKVAVNIDKYTPFQQRLTQVLERIAKQKGETTLMKKTSGAVPSTSWASGGIFEAAGEFSGPLWPGYSRALEAPLDIKSDFVFVVNTSRTRMHDKTTWKWYCVPKAAVPSPQKFVQLDYNAYEQRKREVCPDQARIHVEFLDRNGMALVADEIFVSESAPGSHVDLRFSGNDIRDCTWAISPYLVQSWAYARSVSILRQLKVPLRTLAEIESVRCTVTSP